MSIPDEKIRVGLARAMKTTSLPSRIAIDEISCASPDSRSSAGCSTETTWLEAR
jgi:hypothetical protein